MKIQVTCSSIIGSSDGTSGMPLFPFKGKDANEIIRGCMQNGTSRYLDIMREGEFYCREGEAATVHNSGSQMLHIIATQLFMQWPGSRVLRIALEANARGSSGDFLIEVIDLLRS